MTDSCLNCKFYVKEALQPKKGECHANAPTLHILIGQNGPLSLGGWPPTQDHLWCGEHKPKMNGHGLEK